jgi:hypothetical protein
VLCKLIALSATRGGKKTFSVHEMKAMAAACETLMSVDAKGSVLFGVQTDFIESFARAAVAYFKHAEEIAHRRTLRERRERDQTGGLISPSASTTMEPAGSAGGFSRFPSAFSPSNCTKTSGTAHQRL